MDCHRHCRHCHLDLLAAVIVPTTTSVHTQVCVCVWGVGAGEDVEGVLARLQAQASENSLLRERQAKASSDLQVWLFVLQGTPPGGAGGEGGA